MTQFNRPPTRHRFILNPYSEQQFESCPKCHGSAEQRKFPLLIHVHPLNPVAINKTCCYCSHCDLIIAEKRELEEQLTLLFEKHAPDLIGNEYVVMGTLDHDVWDRGQRVPLTIPELVSNLYVFQEVLRIEHAGRQANRPKPTEPTPRSPWIARGKPVERKPRRNDPCWCGSGKKYKNCHLATC